MMITGYNLPHLAIFTPRELNQFTAVLPRGLTYRLYGGEESRNYSHTAEMDEFLARVSPLAVNGDVAWVYTRERPLCPVPSPKYICYENEQYLFPRPTIWKDGWRDWYLFNFKKAQYYRELAQDHIMQFTNWLMEHPDFVDRLVISLPLKVHDNAGFKAYAQRWLQVGPNFDIDLHVYGDDPHQLRMNLEWYRQRTSRTIHIMEFNGLENKRSQAFRKNTAYHITRHAALINTIQAVLGDQMGEILYFTLAANGTALGWRNPPFLHKYEVVIDPDDGMADITNTINNVWS